MAFAGNGLRVSRLQDRRSAIRSRSKPRGSLKVTWEYHFATVDTQSAFYNSINRILFYFLFLLHNVRIKIKAKEEIQAALAYIKNKY